MSKENVPSKQNEKLLLQATVSEVAEALAVCLKQAGQDTGTELSKATRSVKKFVYGIKGLAQLCGCSRAKAQRLKSSGKIDQAIFQDGHTIIIDAELALQLIQKKDW